MALDKNMAAFLSEGARTIQVVFENNDLAKPYTYISDLPLEKGDMVVVKTGDKISVGFVLRVDDDLKIEPDSDIKYHWIIAKVDTSYHEENEKKISEINELVKTAYRTNMKRSFAQQILSGLDEDSRERILSITSDPKKKKKKEA
jgi:hypothetical protein